MRKLLVEGLAGQKLPSTFASPLSNDVPVKNQVREGFHGYCDIHVRGWHDHGAGCHATSFTVHSISLQLTKCGKLLPVELLIATFIHELAHTVTRPEMRLASTVPASVLKLQPQVTPGDRLVPVHHSDDFYANFRELLRLAERLSIFTLPPGPNKFSQKALMRFDNTDPDASLAGMNLGRSDRFGTALGGKRRPLRALLTAAGSAKQKPLSLCCAGECTVAHVLKEAKKRLNLRKKPVVVADAAGNKIDDERLRCLFDSADDSIVTLFVT